MLMLGADEALLDFLFHFFLTKEIFSVKSEISFPRKYILIVSISSWVRILLKTLLCLPVLIFNNTCYVY